MPRSTTDNQAVSLFFAFPDGVYHYVCAECTALCCRGQGFGDRTVLFGSLGARMDQVILKRGRKRKPAGRAS